VFIGVILGGYEGYAYPHPPVFKVGHCTRPTFKRYKRPSFELCPDPAGEAFSTPQDPLVRLRALLLNGGNVRKGRWRGWEWKEGKGEGWGAV